MDIMTQIREGMHVVDSDGKDVGKVRDFQAGDTEGVTAGGPAPDESLVGSVGILMDADLPREEAERLSHSGWVKVHKGLFTGDRFLPADEIDRVDDDKLWLKPGITLK
ncbi:MAG: hypothetical protein M3116_03030 [Actinomycetota bacterium]|nr:hypothetical protein [Actinomycetota bacterium]